MTTYQNNEFIDLAPEVYGRYWKTNIHRHLGYDYKTIRNWVRSVNEPPSVLLVLLALYVNLRFKYVPSENAVRKVRRNGN